jgi:hypothetical protein
MIAFRSRKKRRNFDKTFRNLKIQSPMSLGALNDEGINNVVNLSSEELSQEETNLLNQGLKSCVGFCSNIETYVADIETTIVNLKEEIDKSSGKNMKRF